MWIKKTQPLRKELELGPHGQWFFLAVRCLLAQASAAEKRAIIERVRSMSTVEEAMELINDAQALQLDQLPPHERAMFPRVEALAAVVGASARRRKLEATLGVPRRKA